MLSMAGANQSGERVWFVLQTFANKEKAVENTLRAAGVLAYLPFIPGGKKVRRGRVAHCADRPALPGYIMVSFVPSPAAIAGLLRVKFVDDFVGGAEKPHRIRDETMNRFKVLLGEWSDVKAHAEAFAAGDWVRFDEGPFVGYSGHISRIRKMVLVRGMRPVGVEGVVEVEINGKRSSITTPLALLVKM
ncbi:transcription termination/antitermination NusG family protein [Rhizobium sp. ARZ01]|nr:transcription termination/antitermination NusG family protein [Rhizobium sp. ARZ01]